MREKARGSRAAGRSGTPRAPRTLSYSMPTETAPRRSARPRPRSSGTLPRADRPSVPLSISMTSRPARASLGSVETSLPICAGSGCDQRTPRVSMTTTYSAPVELRTRSASACTGPRTDGGPPVRSAASRGDAVVPAMARARRMAWSSSCALSGARNRPVARTVTPVATANCISRTCENTRRGHPNRRRRVRGAGSGPYGVHARKGTGTRPGTGNGRGRERRREGVRCRSGVGPKEPKPVPGHPLPTPDTRHPTPDTRPARARSVPEARHGPAARLSWAFPRSCTSRGPRPSTTGGTFLDHAADPRRRPGRVPRGREDHAPQPSAAQRAGHPHRGHGQRLRRHRHRRDDRRRPGRLHRLPRQRLSVLRRRRQ